MLGPIDETLLKYLKYFNTYMDVISCNSHVFLIGTRGSKSVVMSERPSTSRTKFNVE